LRPVPGDVDVPEALEVISALSVQETLSYTCTGSVQVWPWSVDFVKTVEKPLWRSQLRNAEYTAPVFGTTSMVGSYCAFERSHSQRGTCGLQVAPPSLEIVSGMKGVGQWTPQSRAA
jgi:hypothetical protein